jgi:PKD repeat protein
MSRKLWDGVCLVAAAFAVWAVGARATTTYPAVNADNPAAVEGASFNGQVATFQDQPLPKSNTCAAVSDYSVTVDWGDSTTTNLSASFVSGPDQSNLCNYAVNDSHTYGEEGGYTLNVLVQGPNSSTPGSGTGGAAVADAALSASSADQRALAGVKFAGLVAGFSDADPGGTVGDYTAKIDWGDGSSDPGTVSPNGSGGFTVQGEHTWSSPGSYSVTVTVFDAGGSHSSTSFTAVVASPPPSAGNGPTAQLALKSSAPAAGHLITLSAAGSRSTSPIVSYDWDFNGDGHVDTSTGTNPDARLVFSPGAHTASVTVVDAAGERSTATRTFLVSGRTQTASFTRRSHGARLRPGARRRRLQAGRQLHRDRPAHGRVRDHGRPDRPQRHDALHT